MKRRNNNKKLILIIPEPLLDEADYHADNLYISRLAFIRQAIAFYIEHLKRQNSMKGETKNGLDIWE